MSVSTALSACCSRSERLNGLGQQRGETSGQGCSRQDTVRSWGRPEHLDERLVRHSEVLTVASEQHPVTPVSGQPSDLGGEAGLADARFAEDPHPTERFRAAGLVEDRPTVRQLVGAPTEQLPGVDSEFFGQRNRDKPGRVGPERAVLWCALVELDVGNEAVAAAVHGLDRPLRGAVVVNRSASLLDAGGERRLGRRSGHPRRCRAALLS